MLKNERRLLAALAILSIPVISRAQFSDSTQYRINLNTSGSINRTNDGTTYLLNNGLNFNVKKKDFSLDFNNGWLYGRQNGNETNNDFNTSLTFDLYRTFPHFFYWGLATYTTSYSLKIDNQTQVGAGIAYSIIDDDNQKKNYLRISDGVLFDRSDLVLARGSPDHYSTYRNSLRLSYRFTYKDLLVFGGTHFLQNSLNSRSDYIIRSTSDLTFKLNKWLGLTATMVYNRQNRTDSYNLLFTYGLTMEKYF